MVRDRLFQTFHHKVVICLKCVEYVSRTRVSYEYNVHTRISMFVQYSFHKANAYTCFYMNIWTHAWHELHTKLWFHVVRVTTWMLPVQIMCSRRSRSELSLTCGLGPFLLFNTHCHCPTYVVIYHCLVQTMCMYLYKVVTFILNVSCPLPLWPWPNWAKVTNVAQECVWYCYEHMSKRQ